MRRQRKPILTFDCYGTLLDTRPIVALIERIAQKNSLEKQTLARVFDETETRLMIGSRCVPFKEILSSSIDECGRQFGLRDIDAFKRELLECYCSLNPFPEVVHGLRRLAKENELYVISNSAADIIECNLRSLGVSFAGYVVADRVGAYKPSLKFFEAVERELGLNTPDTRHIHVAAGFFWDIIPATLMGWNKIWVNRSRSRGDETYRPYVEIRDLEECVAVVESMIRRNASA